MKIRNRHMWMGNDLTYRLVPYVLKKLEQIPHKLIVFSTCIWLMHSACIKAYEPVIESADAVKYVVTGQVIKGDQVQVVNISTTSSVGNPKYIPVSGCKVEIIDGNGVSYSAADKENGKYEVEIPSSAIQPGSSFKVDINVPGRAHIVSDFDQINECPEMSDVYYEPEDVPNVNPQIAVEGIRFFVDLDAESVPTRNFMWELTETWEFHSVYPIEWYYDGALHHVLPPSDSLRICWQTNFQKNVFTLTTKNFSKNRYNHFPLHLVDNYSSSRLQFGYSLLVRQYALSDQAFAYWQKIQYNSNDQGGLYEKQPMVLKGNLHNLTNPEQQVLGFFGAGEVKSKRIFIKSVEGMPILYDRGCSADGEIPRRMKLNAIPFTAFPAYLYATEYGFLFIFLEPYCYDCRKAAGGDTIKPAFWPL